jgi:gamma-glutamyl-gamma-aminobutyrate hydrolase PuuD
MKQAAIGLICRNGDQGSLAAYRKALEKGGAHIRYISPRDNPKAALHKLDGLVIPDGPAIDGRAYGANAKLTAANTNLEMDRLEIGLVQAAIKKDIAVMGFGRGMNMLNAAAGGVLADANDRTVGAQVCSLIAPGFAAGGLHMAGAGPALSIMGKSRRHLQGFRDDNPHQTEWFVSTAANYTDRKNHASQR